MDGLIFGHTLAGRCHHKQKYWETLMASGPSGRSNQILLAVQGALAACCAASPALAQETPAPAGPQQVQEVVVTGSRI